MSEGQLALFLAVFVLAVFAIAVLGLIARRSPRQSTSGDHADTDRRLADVEKRLDRTNHDIANIKQGMQALPTKEAVHRLELTLADFRGDMREIRTELASATRTIERVDTYLVSKSAPSELVAVPAPDPQSNSPKSTP